MEFMVTNRQVLILIPAGFQIKGLAMLICLKVINLKIKQRFWIRTMGTILTKIGTIMTLARYLDQVKRERLVMLYHLLRLLVN